MYNLPLKFFGQSILEPQCEILVLIRKSPVLHLAPQVGYILACNEISVQMFLTRNRPDNEASQFLTVAKIVTAFQCMHDFNCDLAPQLPPICLIKQTPKAVPNSNERIVFRPRITEICFHHLECCRQPITGMHQVNNGFRNMAALQRIVNKQCLIEDGNVLSWPTYYILGKAPGIVSPRSYRRGYWWDAHSYCDVLESGAMRPCQTVENASDYILPQKPYHHRQPIPVGCSALSYGRDALRGRHIGRLLARSCWFREPSGL